MIQLNDVYWWKGDVQVSVVEIERLRFAPFLCPGIYRPVGIIEQGIMQIHGLIPTESIDMMAREFTSIGWRLFPMVTAN